MAGRPRTTSSPSTASSRTGRSPGCSGPPSGAPDRRRRSSRGAGTRPATRCRRGVFPGTKDKGQLTLPIFLGGTKAMVPGVTYEEITDAITDAYEEDELKRVLRTRMDVRLDVIIGPKPFGTVVFELLGWAERQGRAAELVRATSQARPAHAGMQQIYKKYGMAVPCLVQAAGGAVAGAPADVTDRGLEQLVRPHLRFVDFGVWRERMTRVEGQVCRITLDGAARGTGFLVGPDAVLTNYHVLEPVLKKQVPA